MGKLFKLLKNENSSLYQISFQKLHEIVIKLNLFKEIAIGFNHGLQQSPCLNW